MRLRNSEGGFSQFGTIKWAIAPSTWLRFCVRPSLNQRRLCGTTEAILRSNGIDYFEEWKSIEIGVAGANSPDAVFTQFPDSFATPLASLAQLAKIIWQRSCSYETISIGKLKPSCSLRFKR